MAVTVLTPLVLKNLHFDSHRNYLPTFILGPGFAVYAGWWLITFLGAALWVRHRFSRRTITGIGLTAPLLGALLAGLLAGLSFFLYAA